MLVAWIFAFALSTTASAQIAHTIPDFQPPAPVRWVPTEGDEQLPTHMGPEEYARVQAYLRGRSYKRLYNDAAKKRVGACQVWRIRRHPERCRYRVRVMGAAFPNEQVCSAQHVAALEGCDVGNHKENVGCLVKRALEQGMCF